ncbi:MAG: lysylphosphatidylglycerol synthase domain-containing protein [Rhodospirillales bacterium]
MASWMGTAVNTLLPVATIGGEIAKARVLALWSHPAAEAAATMTVDKTVQAIVVLLWGLVGTAFLAFLVEDRTAVFGILAGAGLLALGIAGFIAVQVKGGFSFLAGRFAEFTGSRAAAGLVDDAEAMERSIREVYGGIGRLAASSALRLAGQVLLALEVVLAGYLMGVPIGVLEAVILKGIVTAIRGMAFAVPAGLGIQEGGYMAIGALIGQPPDLMIAVSLATRVREIVPSIPFLLLWQTTEGKAAWRGFRQSAEAEDGTGKPE